MTELEKALEEHIIFIYGEEQAGLIFQRIIDKLDRFRLSYPKLAVSSSADRVSEEDTILITYGDMVQSESEAPLQTLATFLQKYLSGVVNTIHILPFYPYSSDDGFSVINYFQVNPDFGGWDDITSLRENFRLMFDAVINHISSQSAWFQGFLAGDTALEEYFTVVEASADLSRVFRPRSTPVLTSFKTALGEKMVWTTFGADQIDLNFKSIDLLLEVLDVLLAYVAQGAQFIRLDAIGFIWKEIGTSCIHLPQTHRIIKLLRTILDIIAPRVSLITETNVPHNENISYFGNGFNEAQMVYNFTLPPLILHAFYSGSVEVLSQWAKTLKLPSDQTTFFNFLASHDGIGLMPLQGILPDEVIQNIVERVETLGGFVSYKDNPDGSQTAYELNINYLDALGDIEKPDEDIDTVTQRFLASQAIMLALRGVPGIYFHSLFGSRNWYEGVERTERYRTINRKKLKRSKLEQELENTASLRYKVFNGYLRLLKARKNNPAFHPCGRQKIFFSNKSIFSLLRTSKDGQAHALCLHNISDNSIRLTIDLEVMPFSEARSLFDIICQKEFSVVGKKLHLSLSPYQVLWLQSPNINSTQ